MDMQTIFSRWVLLQAVVCILNLTGCQRRTDGNQSASVTHTYSPSNYHIVDGSNRIFGTPGTNGLEAILDVLKTNFWAANGETPKIMVETVNFGANKISLCWLGCLECMLEINCFDSKGVPVERTELGERFKVFPPLNEIGVKFRAYRKADINLRNFFTMNPQRIPDHSIYQVNAFSLPRLFKIRANGEYTLQVRLRLIQVVDPRGSAKLILHDMPPVEVKLNLQHAP